MSRFVYRQLPALEPLEDRLLLSHNAGHNPGGGGGDPPTARYELINLGTLGGTVSEALDVNADGLVVGYASDGSRQLAFVIRPEDTDGDGDGDLWFRDANQDGANDLMIELTTAADALWSRALGVNTAGQVVGFYRTGTEPRAFLITPQVVEGRPEWNADGDGDAVNDFMTDLGTLGGNGSVAFDVNDAGQVVGFARSADGNDYSFLWNPDSANGSSGTLISLGTLGGVGQNAGDSIGAYQINNRGQIVGVSKINDSTSTSGGWLRGFIITPQDTDGDGTPDLWSSLDANGVNTLMTDLGTSQAHSSEAYSLNDAGVIVGEAGSTISEVQGHAVRWDPSADGSRAITDLGGLHKGRFYSTAQDINENGVVVGFSQQMTVTLTVAGGQKLYEPTGEERAFVVQNGKMAALDGLVSGLAGFDTVNAALAVSDTGHVAGWGEIDGNRRAFIAVPSGITATSTQPVAAAKSLGIAQMQPPFRAAGEPYEVDVLIAATLAGWRQGAKWASIDAAVVEWALSKKKW